MTKQEARNYFKLATYTESRSQSDKNKAFDSMPLVEGMTKVYMPYGINGRGFYYQHTTDLSSMFR